MDSGSSQTEPRQLNRDYIITICLVMAALVYVVLPLFIKGYQVDPSFSGIITGAIGLSSLTRNQKKDDPPGE